MAILTLEEPGDGVPQERTGPTVWVILRDSGDGSPSPLSVHRTLASAKAAWVGFAWEDDDYYRNEDFVETRALAAMEGSARIGDGYYHIYERLLED